MMRLDKYLAERTGMTRSESRKAITKGRVAVNGAVCRKADTQVAEDAAIAVDGAPLAGAYKKYVYIMLNKPEGVVSASRDKRDTTVVDLVAEHFPRRALFPAGRLDKTSTGFVLLTDDGALAHDLLSPAHHVDKQYLVTLDTPLTDAMQAGFAAGVTLADGQTLAPAEVEPAGEDPCVVRVILHQGVYHQIKRMFGVYGAGVNALHREAIGKVALDPALAPGQWRELTPRKSQISSRRTIEQEAPPHARGCLFVLCLFLFHVRLQNFPFAERQGLAAPLQGGFVPFADNGDHIPRLRVIQRIVQGFAPVGDLHKSGVGIAPPHPGTDISQNVAERFPAAVVLGQDAQISQPRADFPHAEPPYPAAAAAAPEHHHQPFGPVGTQGGQQVFGGGFVVGVVDHNGEGGVQRNRLHTPLYGGLR